MSENVPWQAFSPNGELVVGRGISSEKFRYDATVIIGSAHVWVWRHSHDDGRIEVLFHKRDASKTSWPGYYDASVGGHINVGECAIESAIREVKEGTGIESSKENLEFVAALRMPLDKRGIKYTYTYELKSDEKIDKFNNDEFTEIEWWPLDRFVQASTDPVRHRLVPHGSTYYQIVIDFLQSQMTS